jgi:branched-chain amino acid transport system permease protein
MLFIQFLNGIVYGGLLYLMAVGLVLIFGLREIGNFAHGALFMLGAYVAYTFLGWYWAGLVMAILLLALFGALLDISVFRPLRRHDHMVTILVTFGILLVLESLAMVVWGKDLRSVPVPDLLSGTIPIVGSPFPVYRLFVIGVSLLVAISLSLWLRYTRIGLQVRAASVDPVTTAMQGANTNRLSVIVVSLGTALAGLAGVVAAPLMAVSPSMGNFIVIESFIVVVLGGLGSFTGAFVAAMLIGQIHNFGVIYVPWAATMFPFLLMMAVLIWRPTGIAGMRT